VIDGVLLIFGLVLLIYAAVMTGVYLVNEKGSLLDPITISWAGNSLFVGGAMVLTAITRPERGRDEVVFPCAMMMLVGTFTYTIGLYLGKQKGLARMFPTPRRTLSDAQIWFMWLVSITAFGLSFAALQVAPMVAPAMVNPLRGIIDGSMGAAALLSVMVIVGYQGRFGTKLVMGVTLIATSALILAWSWSRRPLVGVLVAAGAFFYRAKISHRSLNKRLLFLFSLTIAAITLLLFLSATRGRRFYGEVSAEYSILSLENVRGFTEGITINYEVAEFALVKIPSSYPYLWGSGFVPAFTFLIPRAIWPDKPFGTGWYLTTIWYHKSNPENNLAQTIIAEWYTNFSYPGVALGMLLIGIIVRAMNTWLRQESRNNVLWPAWLLILPDFASEWRGDFTSMTVQAFLRISVFVMLAWVAGKFAGGPAEIPVVPAMPTAARQPLPARVARALRNSRRPPVCGP
jgi:oligosaccharide repeat unit polymerase